VIHKGIFLLRQGTSFCGILPFSVVQVFLQRSVARALVQTQKMDVNFEVSFPVTAIICILKLPVALELIAEKDDETW